MPAAIENGVKTNVIKQRLDGDTRDKIAAENHIGAGTVSGIISEFKKGVDALEYEFVRELSISCKKQGINLGALASYVRINNYVQRLGANQDEIETHIADVANFPEPKKLFDVANQIAQISMSESIPLDMLADRIKRQKEEKQRLEEEIKQIRTILESANVDIQTLNEHRQLEEELHKHGFSMQHPHNLISVLQTISQIGYDPKKIVSVCSLIKSLRQTERQLIRSCKVLESQQNRYREVLPLCEQVMRARIGFPELLALHDAVSKKAGLENLSMGTAAYCKLGDANIYDESTVNALMKLQLYGITENQILNLCKTFETNGAQPTNSYSLSAF